MLEIKNVAKMKTAVADFVAGLRQLRKESLSLGLSQYKPKTERQREQKLKNKTEQSTQELRDNHKRCNIHKWEYWKRRKKQKEYLKQ